MHSPYRDRPPCPCPRCRVSLVKRRVAGIAVWDCRGCGGVWLSNRGLVDVLLASDAELASAVSRDPGPPGAWPVLLDGPLLCPHCAGQMRREFLSRAERVQVDLCDAHGLWFDPGELSAFLAAAGGRKRDSQTD